MFDADGLALVALLLAVVMHVSWNLLAKRYDAQVDLLWWALLGYVLLFGWYGFTALWRVPHWSTELSMLLLVSASANTAYFLSLRWAYRGAPASVVYPIARASPLLIALWMSLLWHNTLSVFVWMGVLLSVASLWGLAWLNRAQASGFAILFAMLAAFFTSIYSLSDALIAQVLTELDQLMGVVAFGYAVSWLALTGLRYVQGKQLMPTQKPTWVGGLIASVSIGFAYVFTIYAMSALNAVVVVSMTNAGIVLLFFLSIVWLKEPVHGVTNWLLIVLLMLGLSLVALG